MNDETMILDDERWSRTKAWTGTSGPRWRRKKPRQKLGPNFCFTMKQENRRWESLDGKSMTRWRTMKPWHRVLLSTTPYPPDPCGTPQSSPPAYKRPQYRIGKKPHLLFRFLSIKKKQNYMIEWMYSGTDSPTIQTLTGHIEQKWTAGPGSWRGWSYW